MADLRRHEAIALMTRFAERTGLFAGAGSRRYLWTDAFATCNFLGLSHATGDPAYGEIALRLVDAVHQVVSQRRDLKEVRIRTVLRRLEQKGYLQHDIEGRAYIYRAVDAPRNVAARAIRHILDRFCHGSVEELISGLVESEVLSDAELDRLEATVKARARTRTVTSPKKGRHDGPPR